MEQKHIQNFASFTEKLKQQRAIQEENEKSGKQEQYAQFFKKTLQKFNVTSPSDLTDDKKSAFFDEISKGWEEGEGLTPSGEEMMSEGRNAFLATMHSAQKHGSATFEFNGKKYTIGQDVHEELNKNEGNEFTGALKDAKDKGEEEFEVGGEKFKVEEELAKIAKLEGNEFTGALKDAKDKGEDEFEVDGEKFKVEEELAKIEESEKKSEVITESLSGIQKKMSSQLHKDQVSDLDDALDDIYKTLYHAEFDAEDVDSLILAIADEVSRRHYKM